jgi:hypothetical protein
MRKSFQVGHSPGFFRLNQDLPSFTGRRASFYRGGPAGSARCTYKLVPFLRDHALRLMHLSRVLTNTERYCIDAELDQLLTKRKTNTLLSVASLPSTGATPRSSFIPFLSFVSAQPAPSAAKTSSNAPLDIPTAPHTSAGTTTRSLPARHDSSVPYSALPDELFSSRVRSSRTGEGNSAEQSKDSHSNDRPRSEARPRKDACPRQDARHRPLQRVRGLQDSDDRSSCAKTDLPVSDF